MTIRQVLDTPATVSGPRLERSAETARPTPTASWTKPVLTVYGDVRELTMGSSPATGESGNPLNFRT